MTYFFYDQISFYPLVLVPGVEPGFSFPLPTVEKPPSHWNPFRPLHREKTGVMARSWSTVSSTAVHWDGTPMHWEHVHTFPLLQYPKVDKLGSACLWRLGATTSLSIPSFLLEIWVQSSLHWLSAGGRGQNWVRTLTAHSWACASPQLHQKVLHWEGTGNWPSEGYSDSCVSVSFREGPERGQSGCIW